MSSRSIYTTENLILEREILAQRLKQSKGMMVATSPRATSPPLLTKPAPIKKKVSSLSCQPYGSNRVLVIMTDNKKPIPSSSCKTTTAVPSANKLRKKYKHNSPVEPDDGHSISTATMTTMTHEQAPPLHLSSFKPAAGCVIAAEYLIRCFVARLRSGVTVYKHSRSRFLKSPRPYILQIDRDGETLLWRPAAHDYSLTESSNRTSKKDSNNNGSPANASGAHRMNKRLNLAECQEVRLASTADPDNPRFTGSAILREKCEPCDAHKSFSLIFNHRTLDITSMSADQCKMLIEGFSALCYRLHLKTSDHDEQRCCPSEEIIDSSDSQVKERRRRCFQI